MASLEFNTMQSASRVAQITELPSVTLPEDVRLGEPITVGIGAQSIEISTWGGDEITVSGTVEALVLHRLVLPEWLPGVHGNNSTSQTVFFGESGPSLYRGNPGARKLKEPFIRIVRRDSRRYNVILHPTDEQRLVLKKLKEDEQSKRDAEREKQIADKAKLSSASALQDQLGVIDLLEKTLNAERAKLQLLERGIRKDPGRDAALKEVSDGGDAKFKVGDIAICRGHEVIITGEYSFRRVVSGDGPMIGDDGRRIFYSWGYTARSLSGSDDYYFAAHELKQKDGAIKHLKLASSH